ncbi:MAG: type II toxin-antitoxin system VapC family toxin [Acidobacteriaceae bacterium]|nr:type II toxin-antitoxin system VapC family toxin [Acidobacteriaceae bacterium]
MLCCLRDNEVFVSAAAAWEIAIKNAQRRIALPTDPATYFPARVKTLGFKSLAITVDHALAVHKLPPLHRDPFDRIMIAQAQMEGLTLVTNDSAVRKYRVKTLSSKS